MAGRKIGEAFIRVRPDTEGFERETGSKLKTTLLGVAKAAGVVVGAVFAGAVATGFSSVKAARDLAETQSKINVIFGKSAGAVIKFGDAAAGALGQSKQSALDAAANFAIFGKSAGLSGGNLVTFSEKLVGASADMASFANTSPEEAIQAIGAALRGESEPIRKYGVLLNEATLRNRALKLGLVDTTKEALTPQQRVLAANAEIFAQLGKKGSKTLGDFARTTGGLANQQRIAAAQVANLKTKIGAALLPVVTTAVTFFNNRMIPALSGIASRIQDRVMPALRDFGVWVRTRLVPALQQFGRWVKDEILPRLVALGNYIRDNIIPVVKDLVERAIKAAVVAWKEISKTVRAHKTELMQLWAGFKTVVDFIVKKVLPVVGPLFTAGVKFAILAVQLFIVQISLWVRAFNTVKGAVIAVIQFVGRMISAFRTAFEGARRAVIDRAGALVGFLRGLPGRIVRAVGNLGGLLFNAGRDIIRGLIDGIRNMGGVVRDFITGFIRDHIPGPVRKILGLGSPSKLFAGFGRDTVRGLVQGLQAEAGTVSRTMARLVPRPVPIGFGVAGAGTLAGLAGAGVGGVHIHLHNEGVIGSQRELDNWVIRSVDRLRRERRL